MGGSLSRWMIKFAGLGLRGPDFFDGDNKSADFVNE